MKEAVIIDLEGNDTFKRTLVADHVTGVFPIQEPVPDTDELEPMEEAPEVPTEPETVHVGYTVAVPVPPGLFKPRYDLKAWQAAMEQYERDLNAWKQEQQQRDEEEAEPLPPPEPVDLAQFWVEGLTPEEIDEIRNRPQEPSIPERVEKVENDTAQTMLGLVEVYEANEATDEENKQSMLAMVELYGIIEAQAEAIEVLRAEMAALKGGEG
ncbi:hypothetical protein [Paenibacillus sp. 32O-W]|uniref:hypothetical protein n=1 Tax=Paenibacillus sp. 32O-W TaxID=1695218 RepID=UPI0011A45CEB|nr:hypothetical protein [Paenibacillus sp. 32O-W]